MKKLNKKILVILFFILLGIFAIITPKTYAYSANVSTVEDFIAKMADETCEVIVLDADITLNNDNTSSYYGNHYYIATVSSCNRYLDLNGHTLTQEDDVSLQLTYTSEGKTFEVQDYSEEQTGKIVTKNRFANIYNGQNDDNRLIFNRIDYENTNSGNSVLNMASNTDKKITFLVDNVNFYYTNNSPLSNGTNLVILGLKVYPKNQTGPIGFYNDSNELHLSDILGDTIELYENGVLWTGDAENTWARDIFFATNTENACIELRQIKYTVSYDMGIATDVTPLEQIEVVKNGYIMPPDTYSILYNLDGWYKEPEFTNKWEFETDTVTANTTIYAKWTLRNEYDVWVGAHRFTKDNLTVNLDEGNAVFNPSTATITLNNATITNTYEWQPWYEACIYSELPEISINLVGNNNISPNTSYGDAIDVPAGCNVVINGAGKLNINGGYYGMYIGEGGTPGGDLRILNGATITVTNPSAAGIWVNSNVDIINSKVYILKETGLYSGMVSNEYGTITINNSVVNIQSGAQAIHFGNPVETNHRLHIISGTVILTSTSDGADVIHTYEDSSVNVNCDISLDSGKLQLNVPTNGRGTNTPAEDIHILSELQFTKGTSFRDSATASEGITIIAESMQFPDVPVGRWFTDGIRYCKDNGIMGGYTSGANAGKFGLDDTITRGQIATMLYRLALEPDTTGLANPFTDVPDGKYYTNPIKWALSKGITTGKTATTFDPDGPVTRQELAVFMARYSKEISGNDITSTYNISGIADYNNLSTWARGPMQYIMEKGVITGDMALGYPRILPKANATRATAATMFMRFGKTILNMP